ncbi:hypothetical protein VCV18_011442 [Metarhizium anisopliae]
MEDDLPDAVHNCYTCKRDLPEVEFRSVKDSTKYTRQCTGCRTRQKERVAESRAAVAGLRNIASRLSSCKTTKRTDSLADLTPPRRTAPTPSPRSGIQSPPMPPLFRGLAPAVLGPSNSGTVDKPSSSTPTPSLPTVVLGTPIPRSTHSTGPVVVLGTPIPQESLPPTPSLAPQGHRRGRYTRQGSQPQERQFDQIVDPPFTGESGLPALSAEDQALVREFYTALDDDKMHSCLRCKECWFDMKPNRLNICARCISRDRKRGSDEPYFFSAENNLDFGEVPNNLPDLTMVEEMLIARVHVHVKVLQVRGAQYKYRGHVVHFLRNVSKLFQELPVLPENLDIILLRPPAMDGDPRLQKQFARDFRVRRSCLLIWLRYLQQYHQGYREVVVREDLLQRLPVDGSIADSIAIQVADIPDREAPQGPVEEAAEEEEDPSDADASAIPNLQITETELNVSDKTASVDRTSKLGVISICHYVGYHDSS